MRRIFTIAAAVLLSLGATAQEGVGPDLMNYSSPEIDRFSLQHSGAVDPMGAGFAITFDRAVAATYASEIGGVVLDVAGTPVRATDGTYPAGVAASQGYGWRFNGSTDYLSITDAASGGAFDPAGSFSVMAVVTPSTVAAGSAGILSKRESTGNQFSWSLYRSGSSVILNMSDDGSAVAGHTSYALKTSALSAGVPACIVATYQYVADGTSIGSIYVDELSVGTNTSMDGPVFNSTSNFEVGATDTGASPWAGRQDHVEFANGIAWSAAQAVAKCRQYRGLLSAAGTPVLPTSAAPPATLVCPPGTCEPHLVSQPVDSTQVGSPATGMGGLIGNSGLANLAQRRSLESWAAGAPTGWTEGITSTGDCAQGTARVAHGASSARCSLADADDAVSLTGACLTVTGATLYELSAWARLESGTGLLDLDLIEDDSADCATPTTTTSVVNDAVPDGTWGLDVGGVRRPFSGTITTQAGTIRVRVRVNLPAAAAQVLDVDAIQLRAVGAYPKVTHFCPGDTDATASCSAILLPHASALRDHANGETQISFVASTPYAGTEIAADSYLISDGTPLAANSLSMYIDSATDEAGWVVTDAASAVKTVEPNAANWAASTDYTVKATFDGRSDGADNNLRLWWNAAWQTTTGGAGTGMRSAGQATTYLSGTSTVGSDVWIRNLCYCRTIGCVCDWSAP